VLVGGEHWKTTTGDRWLGQHCSLQFVGRAYEALVGKFGRDRIIVITQLTQTIAWLSTAVATGQPLFTKNISVEESSRRWDVHLQSLKKDCRRLIDDGGPDYEGTDCHPASVLDVLTGKPTPSGGRVVDRTDGSCVLLGLYSHGWSHETFTQDEAERRARIEATIVCDVCGKTHSTQADRDACPEHSSLSTREWYLHMEHEVPEDRRDIYGPACTAAHEHPYSLLYTAQLIAALSSMFQAAPKRPVLILHNYCGSGGMLKWMRRPSYRKHTPLASWPLSMMTASGELEGAIPGLMPIYCRLLAAWLGSTSKCNDQTVGWLYKQVQDEYAKENPALTEPIVQAQRCLLCSFAGNEATRWLCSVCYKRWDAQAPEESEDLDKLRAARIDEDANAADASSKRPRVTSFCSLDVEYGLSDLPSMPLSKLFAI
jgi:hypothetical protein